MNISRERSKSLWMEAPGYRAGPLSGRQTADVVVIGAGIAGLSVAYELASKALSVVVLDRGPIATGISARTTAHLASAWDDGFDHLISKRGEENARRCFESHAAAIDRIEEICRTESIACDFARLDGFLFAPDDDGIKLLEQEFEACRKIGFPGVHWAEAQQLKGDWQRALRFPNQGRLHPVKYMTGLARCIEKLEGRLFADTAVKEVKEEGASIEVVAENGSVSAAFAVVATNSPINDRTAIHTKQAPYRTYAIAAPIERGSMPDALFWDTHDPYHYVRFQPGEQSDFIIVGGEDHKSAEANDGEERVRKLEDWARGYFPRMGDVTHRWSGQVQEPIDGAAFIGLNPGNDCVFVVTGDSGQGMTHGALAGLLIGDMIRGHDNEWSELYQPNRAMAQSPLAYVSENLTALKGLGEFLLPGEVDSVDEIKPGEGAIVRDGLKKIAAYRDDDGALYQKSAACTHLGCQLQWNSFERCWDCACHGSHFAGDGSVLNAPAISPLADIEAAKVEEDAAAEAK